MSQRKVQSPRATVVKRLGELGMMSRLRTPTTRPTLQPCPQAGAPPSCLQKNRAGPEAPERQLHPCPASCHPPAARLGGPVACQGVPSPPTLAPLTRSGPSAGTGASHVGHGGAEGGTRGQGCPGASGSDPSPGARPSWRGQRRQTSLACGDRGGEVSLARPQAPNPPSGQVSAGQKGWLPLWLPPQGNLAAEGHHLPNSRRSPTRNGDSHSRWFPDQSRR